MRRLAAALAAVAIVAAPQLARAATYYYVEWSAADVAGGTASGTITLPDGSKVQVQFDALNPDGSHGNLYGAQINGMGTNYWMPSMPYISTQVENAPPDPDIIQLAGGQNQTYKVTLSEAIKDPIMAIVSLGSASITITYDFDSPFTIVSQGVGYWGGGPDALVALPGNVLQGTEGHGTIQFIGTFTTFSWTVPKPETWHGFTFGIRTTERIEPSDFSLPSDMTVSPDLSTPDFAATPDLSTAQDFATARDFATAPAPDLATAATGAAVASGCGCRAGGAPERARAPWALSLLFVGLLAGRRFRRCRRA